MSIKRSEAFWKACWAILVQDCGVNPASEDQFLYDHLNSTCDEWRFQGNMGFGGKFRREAIYPSGERLYITAYREDTTPERKARIQAVNQKLADMQATRNRP